MLTRRTDRAAMNADEKPVPAPADTRDGQADDPKNPDRAQVAAGVGVASAELALDQTQTSTPGALATEQLLQKDMLAIQEKRVLQLESEKQSLEAQLQTQETELDLARRQLDEAAQAEESRGYRNGYERGTAAAAKEYQEKSAALDQAMSLFEDTLSGEVKQVDRYAVELAFAALARVVGDQHANAEFSRVVIEDALEAVRGASTVVVRVSQSDFDALQSVQGDLASAGKFRDLELVADPRVSVGGCLIETDNGSWDARLETQLARLKDTVESSLKSREQN